MSNFCVFTVSEFLSHLRETPEPPGDGNSDFLSFFVFCGRKLLWACLKAPALTGYVRDGHLRLGALRLALHSANYSLKLGLDWNGVWGRGCNEAEISEERAFAVNEGKAFSE